MTSTPNNKQLNNIDVMHQQMEENPFFPYNVRSGWQPDANSPAVKMFLEEILSEEPKPWASCIQDMDDYLSSNEVLSFLVQDACDQNENIYEAAKPSLNVAYFPRIKDKEQLLNAFNTLLTRAPHFKNDELVGLPYSSLVVGIDPTQSGMTLFRLPDFNKKMKNILNEWHTYLGSEKSSWLFAREGEQWLSDKAKKSYQFEIWEQDQDHLPYWTSWNSFFTRDFKDKTTSRPITKQHDNSVVVSANDGSLFRWDNDVQALNAYWFKDMSYSLANILSSRDPVQDAILKDHNILELFEDGYLFQTYLNPYNFHRWWCPVNGQIVFDPMVIEGDYFNKLVIPDFGGATTASLPYLVQVNARGLMVIKTEDYGYVCCIPLGMSEVSTITFNSHMKRDRHVQKGDEMGMFQYGGSSYALIFQKLPGQGLFFQSETGVVYPQQPALPKGSSGTGGTATMIGSQIGKWQDINFEIDSTLAWQNSGYVNDGWGYVIQYVGGQWTANPNQNDGNLYGPDGSTIVATSDGYPMQGQMEGALIGQIGDNAPFLIGSGPTITPAGQTGPLKLCINDDLNHDHGAGLRDNEGAITVSIKPS